MLNITDDSSYILSIHKAPFIFILLTSLNLLLNVLVIQIRDSQSQKGTTFLYSADNCNEAIYINRTTGKHGIGLTQQWLLQ